jgi:hypothetical protein
MLSKLQVIINQPYLNLEYVIEGNEALNGFEGSDVR